MDIKVGDKVTTPDGKAHVVVSAGLSVGGNYIFSRGNEPVTDTSQAVPDYNNGEWWGWNGGERPVHPKTRGDMTYADGAVYENVHFGIYKWDEPLLFRVTKPYVEPKVEVVEAYARAALGGCFEVSSFADYWDWRITFNTIDGEPDPASIKMERMRD